LAKNEEFSGIALRGRKDRLAGWGMDSDFFIHALIVLILSKFFAALRLTPFAFRLLTVFVDG
jgi:hypothetical protein